MLLEKKVIPGDSLLNKNARIRVELSAKIDSSFQKYDSNVGKNKYHKQMEQIKVKCARITIGSLVGYTPLYLRRNWTERKLSALWPFCVKHGRH